MNWTLLNICTRKGLLVLTVSLCLSIPQGFAATSDKDFMLDDGSGDSPQLILTDGNDKKLILQKFQSGEAQFLNDEGSICFLSSNDKDDYICFVTYFFSLSFEFSRFSSHLSRDNTAIPM